MTKKMLLIHAENQMNCGGSTLLTFVNLVTAIRESHAQRILSICYKYTFTKDPIIKSTESLRSGLLNLIYLFVSPRNFNALMRRNSLTRQL